MKLFTLDERLISPLATGSPERTGVALRVFTARLINYQILDKR
ncbi:hypothetical protein [Halomonas cerina]|uniref:Uncharacterized protein n=1 Tax=Halomonas cerina TaxID=447424 RepID=A0A839VDI7_9GAMM|nr:hypothetical protein [Halomonas cerina]MBB3190566.1 hypothetical protein [Halomonas cerina]